MVRKGLFLACFLALAACTSAPATPNGAMNTPDYIRAVGLLQAHFRGPDAIVRANCVEALQLSKDPRARDVIEAGLHDDEWVVRFASAMAAGKRKERDMLPALETLAISDPNGSVRVASIYALRRMDRTANMSKLDELMRSPDTSTRANTAMVLGLLGDPGTISVLQSYLHEPDNRAHFEITAALARLGDETAQKVIVAESISKFGDDQWRAMEVCGDLPPEIGASPLLSGLEPIAPGVKVDPGVQSLTTVRQLIAARSLAKQRNGQGAAVAINNLTNKEPGLRALALLALGEMLNPDQVHKIAGFLDDPDDNVKRAAAAAIVDIFSRSEAS